MKIEIFHGISGAKEARGTVIIVDIFRAATTAAFALSKGAKYLIPVTTKEEAFELKRKNPHYLLVGEIEGIKIPGFDYGNSPCEMLKADVKDRIIVHRTTNGTKGIVSAIEAEEIIFGSFSTVSAIKDYLLQVNPEIVSIVALDGPGSEDEKFAFYLEDLIQNKKTNIDYIINYLENYDGWGRRFIDPRYSLYPEEDFYLSLEVDRFDFLVLVVEKNSQLLCCKKK